VRRSIIACLVALVAMRVIAAGYGLKPGLWETHMVKQIVDGKDMTAQIAAAAAQMQKMMANLSPEQRARMETMVKGGGANGAFQMCISPEMANRDKPIVDREGHCQPATFNRSGNRTTYEFTCSSNGGTMTGKGVATATGDVIASQVDTTSTRADGTTHVTHTETEMKYLGADCGDVKPYTPPKASP
jgi:hypothetical protein